MASLSTPSAPSFTSGRMLRLAREERGETILQVSQGTRISEDYLAALEADAPLESFPAPVYARAFVRAYARHLGVDEDAVMAAFTEVHGEVDPDPQPVIPIQERPKRGIVFPSMLAIREPLGARRGGASLSGSPWSLRSGMARFLPRPKIRTVWGRGVPVAVTPATRTAPRRRRWPVATWLVAAAAAIVLVAVLLASDLLSLGAGEPAPSSGPALAVLPRGGRILFPDYRVVAFYGAPRTEDLGILGIGPDLALQQLGAQVEDYLTPGRPVLPAFELIATLASSSPGEDKRYRERLSGPLIAGYLDEARDGKLLFVLDIQPGRADFLTEVKVYEKYLKEPDVGLALDSRWHVGKHGVPGEDPGSIDARTINKVGDYLAKLVRENRLPQKLFVVHQATKDMVVDKDEVKSWPELAVTFGVEVSGKKSAKLSKYANLTRGYRDRFFHGIKLAYQHDLSPKTVLGLEPQPDLIVYQ